MAMNGYAKRPLWQWLVLYAVIGAVVYGVVYFFFIKKSNLYNYNSTSNQSVVEQVVDISSYVYSPNSVTVKVGESVKWINNDPVGHSVTMDDGSFDSGVLNNGDTSSYVFETPGTYTYHCSVHPSMKGTVVVTK